MDYMDSLIHNIGNTVCDSDIGDSPDYDEIDDKRFQPAPSQSWGRKVRPVPLLPV